METLGQLGPCVRAPKENAVRSCPYLNSHCGPLRPAVQAAVGVGMPVGAGLGAKDGAVVTGAAVGVAIVGMAVAGPEVGLALAGMDGDDDDGATVGLALEGGVGPDVVNMDGVVDGELLAGAPCELT